MACEQEYHLVSLAWSNLWLHLFEFVSFFAFHGGGEGARCRAMFLLLALGALGTWGMLAWQGMSSDCYSYFDQGYHERLVYLKMCTVANITLGSLYLLHETSPRKRLGFSDEIQLLDATLFVEWD